MLWTSTKRCRDASEKEQEGPNYWGDPKTKGKHTRRRDRWEKRESYAFLSNLEKRADLRGFSLVSCWASGGTSWPACLFVRESTFLSVVPWPGD